MVHLRDNVWPDHRSNDFMILAISGDANQADLAQWVTDSSIPFPVLWDPSMEVINLFSGGEPMWRSLLDRGHIVRASDFMIDHQVLDDLIDEYVPVETGTWSKIKALW